MSKIPLKILEITPEMLNLFEGKTVKWEPAIDFYDYNKLAYGFLDFRIKQTSNSSYSYFNGIFKEGFIQFLNKNGYFKKYRKDGSYLFLFCCDNIIEEIEPTNIADFVTNYLIEKGQNINFTYNDLEFVASLTLQKETIKRQCYFLFNKKYLEQLPNFEIDILKDTATECFKPFKNCICKITKSEITTIAYSSLNNKCVWRSQIIDFNFTFKSSFEKCHFYQFIRNVSNSTVDLDCFKAFISAIGYLLHNFNAPEKGQAVICYDEEITNINKPQGGTGKGLFAKAISLLSNTIKIDGKKFDADNRFCFQRITDSTQLVIFDDVKNKLGFDRFNSILTDGWEIEKKNKDEFSIKPEDSPKVLITSNSILESEGSTRKRRQFIIEFSDFYSKLIKDGTELPIKDFHKCIFFSDDWDGQEWQLFYSFNIYCIREFLKSGLHFYEPKNIKTNRLRQITNEEFANWIQIQNIEINIVYEIKPLYENYKSSYYPDELFSQRRFTGFLKKYAALYDLLIELPAASNGKTFFKLKKK